MISCTPTDLANAAKCFCGMSQEQQEANLIFILCTWAGGAPPTPPTPPDLSIVLGDPDAPFILGDPVTGLQFGTP